MVFAVPFAEKAVLSPALWGVRVFVDVTVVVPPLY
jgi:hypothetical protein